MHESARSATEPAQNTTNNATKTQEFMFLAHVQNLVLSQTCSNELCGASRVRQKLHMVCGIAHKQPQPKRIGVTRVMAKKEKPTKNYK